MTSCITSGNARALRIKSVRLDNGACVSMNTWVDCLHRIRRTCSIIPNKDTTRNEERTAVMMPIRIEILSLCSILILMFVLPVRGETITKALGKCGDYCDHIIFSLSLSLFFTIFSTAECCCCCTHARSLLPALTITFFEVYYILYIFLGIHAVRI